MSTKPSENISLSEATLRLHMNREQVLRILQRGLLEGGLANGRWYVNRQSLERFAAAQEPSPPRARVAQRV